MGETVLRRHIVLYFGLLFCITLSFSASSCTVSAADSNTELIIGSQCTSNADCTEGYFCSKPMSRCDGPGVCVLKPDACITVYDPVCGCDGITYGNSCDAAHFGISVNYPGECGKCSVICDVNFDGGCDISDVILLLRIALQLDPPAACSDINSDGRVDISDVILTLRMALGLDPLRPCI